MKNLIFSLLFLLSITQLFAQKKGTFVSVGQDGSLQIVASLEEYSSIYRMSKIFGVSIDQIMESNNIKAAVNIKSNDVLKVKIDKSRIKLSVPDNANYAKVALFYHVKPAENLYRISKVYFNRSVEEIMKLNNFKSENLAVGSKVLVGYLTSADVNDEDVKLEKIAINEPKVEADIEEIDGPKIVFLKERGIAYVNKSSRSQGKFVLHSSAKLNTDVELYNPLRRTSVRAKVVGRIPKGTYMEDIDVVMSNNTAQSLGALDGRFMVDIKYQLPDEIAK